VAPLPQRIVWLYKRWQPLYEVIRKTVTQEKKSGDWDDQSPDRGLSRDRVLRRRATGPRGSQAPHVHRQYGHVRPWQKCVVNGIIFHGFLYDHLNIVEFHAIWVCLRFS
jgi:hypothetical protein